MRSQAPSLAPIFRSDIQGRLLALVFARPRQPLSVRELARKLGAHVSTVHREIDRLAEAGILKETRVGRTRLVEAGSEPAYLPELSALILKVFGPVPVLEDLLAGIPGVSEAYVFGSWAERYEGIAGPTPGDVDLLVVGRPDREAIYAAATRAREITGLEIDVVIRSTEAWQSQKEGLIQAIRRGHLVPLSVRET